MTSLLHLDSNGWTHGIKPTNNLTRLGPTVVCFVLGTTSAGSAAGTTAASADLV
jgi:hypothetical protein